MDTKNKTTSTKNTWTDNTKRVLRHAAKLGVATYGVRINQAILRAQSNKKSYPHDVINTMVTSINTLNKYATTGTNMADATAIILQDTRLLSTLIKKNVPVHLTDSEIATLNKVSNGRLNGALRAASPVSANKAIRSQMRTTTRTTNAKRPARSSHSCRGR